MTSLGRRFHHVSIVPDDDSLGHVLKAETPEAVRADPDGLRAERWLKRELMAILAGPIAEAHFAGRRNHMGAAGDYENAADVASRLMSGEEVLTAFMAYMVALTHAHVSQPARWVQVEAVASALLSHGRLGAKRVREVCREAVQAKVKAGVRVTPPPV